jgi:hypothetical protein
LVRRAAINTVRGGTIGKNITQIIITTGTLIRSGTGTVITRNITYVTSVYRRVLIIAE